MKKTLPFLIVITSLLTQSLLSADSTPEFLNSGKVYPKGLPFSEAVKVGTTLYLSGQIGAIPGPGKPKLAEGGIKAETKQTLDNIKMSLEAHNYSMDDIVKCTVMLADMKEWGDFNAVYKTYFSKHFPARSAFGSTGLAFGAKIELDCIAAK